MRIVFLDFDGVLNSHAYFNARTEKFEDVGEAGELDPTAVERLNRIIDATGALVVVSSSWRYARSRESKTMSARSSHHAARPRPSSPLRGARRRAVARPAVPVWAWRSPVP